jgi:hypothetical protein
MADPIQQHEVTRSELTYTAQTIVSSRLVNSTISGSLPRHLARYDHLTLVRQLSPEQPIRVFISYHRSDNDAYDGIATKLHIILPQRWEGRTGTRMDTYLDTESNFGGELWHDRMIQELAAATIFLPLVTMRYLRSRRCVEELNAFTNEGVSQDAITRVIPVIVDGQQQIAKASTDEARFIAARQYVDFTDAVNADISSARWKDRLSELVKQIERVVTSAEPL